MDGDFSHGADADRRRAEKATALARFAWDRAIGGAELLALPDDRLRKLARAAGVNPPSTRETWNLAAELLDRKSEWAGRHPDDPRSVPAHADEKIMWVKRPPPAWT
ncbi:hypothetical protein G4X40_00870 [Rhodococcus sp. D2-41]|uniref:Uncharacterized protein n=1 Tax=Speluncibacter jeojiensis TaxID=2710754 RepID=A0A9X4M2A2_9ACTN|nr:hypothetical protein [Rhodococcus sp. D2-41]MDG3008696.1 hypothetical protein [Rhodococcus sp. D2-41]MDG3013096.1 hypothetical protein [Corynebacteriales bacterium D3-21]